MKWLIPLTLVALTTQLPPIPREKPKLIPLPNQKPIRLPPGGLPRKLPLPVLGWADLHAHPASHLAFGATQSGGVSLISGVPGMGHSSSNIASDLQVCNGDHFSANADIVRTLLRNGVRSGLEAGYPHSNSGYPQFAGWPHARSPLHQQMHISWVYRAYLGGQRLMIASVTDNQTLAMAWNRYQQAPPPVFDPTFDFESAKRQISFIEAWANANSSWMQIVTTPQEARTAIQNGKMAVILGVEMDRLKTDQILTLIRDRKVRSVIPIHLADNQFGGTAAYSDMFNTNNHFLNGNFIEVLGDPAVRFRFKRPQYVRYVMNTEVNDFISGLIAVVSLGQVGIGAVVPTPVDDTGMARMKYGTITQGHRNSKFANKVELGKLFKEGVLIDLAHMSEKSQADALAIATAAQYPVLNSHTGMRGAVGESERAMRVADADKMSKLGGVMGIGASGDSGLAVILNGIPPDKQENFVRLTGNTLEFTRAPENAPEQVPNSLYPYMRVRLTTGRDDKRNNEGAWIVLVYKNNARREFPLDPALQGLGGGTTITREFLLNPFTRISDLARVGVRHSTHSYFKDGLWRDPDNWDIASLTITFMPDPITAWTRDAAHAIDVMGGKIALGTDFNGLENLIPGQGTILTSYPVDVVKRFAPSMKSAGGAGPQDLAMQVIGSKTMSFRNDGLAEYGMLPDFLQSVAMYPRGPEIVKALFGGAENVIKMWEASVAAKTRIP